MQTVYSFTGSSAKELECSYSKLIKDEFYDGELRAESRDSIHLKVSKALTHPISLIRIESNTSISYRRTFNHIRANRSGVRVVWFVSRGSLKLVRSRNSCTVAAGEWAILDSSQPFHSSIAPDDAGLFDAMQAIVPAHLFNSHLVDALNFEGVLPVRSADRPVLGQLLDLLAGGGRQLSRSAADPLVAAFLETLSDNIRLHSKGTVKRETIVERRLDDIKSYISKHLTDPDLSYDEVAANCGISPRYLCHLLKANNTSFSELLWGQRLPKARAWLMSKSLERYSIQEIAFMAGFKTAAHFSRRFKAAYGFSPKEFRATVAEERSRENFTIVPTIANVPHAPAQERVAYMQSA